MLIQPRSAVRRTPYRHRRQSVERRLRRGEKAVGFSEGDDAADRVRTGATTAMDWLELIFYFAAGWAWRRLWPPARGIDIADPSTRPGRPWDQQKARISEVGLARPSSM